MWRWWLSPPLFQSGICNFSSNSLSFTIFSYKKIPIFPYTLGKRIAVFLLPEAFCGLKYAENAHDAPPDPLVGWGADTPPHTQPNSASLAPRCSRLRRLNRRAPWHQILATPLVTTTFKSKLRQWTQAYPTLCYKEIITTVSSKLRVLP